MTKLSRRMAIGATLSASLATPRLLRAQSAEVVVHYPMPAFFKDVMEKIAEEFARAHPGLTVRYLAPAPNYEDAVQQVLRQGVAGDAGLQDGMRSFLRERLAHIKCPRWIEFCAELPKTATGKIQRFRLRAQSVSKD